MDKVDMLLEPVRAFLVQIGIFLPRLGLALLVVVAGWLLAKLVRFALVKALRAVNFNIVTERSGMDQFLQQGGSGRDTTTLLGALAYWLVILAAMIVAFNSLGLAHVTELLGRIVLFLPKVIVALLILAFGAYFARFVREAIVTYCNNVGMQDAESLGRIAQYAIVAFVVLIALDQIDVAGDIVRDTFLILLAGIVLALAIAFGLGGRAWAAALLERWWPIARKDDEP